LKKLATLLDRYVFTLQQTDQGREGTPLLEYRRKTTTRAWGGGAEACVVFGGTQRTAGSVVAQERARHPAWLSWVPILLLSEIWIRLVSRRRLKT